MVARRSTTPGPTDQGCTGRASVTIRTAEPALELRRRMAASAVGTRAPRTSALPGAAGTPEAHRSGWPRAGAWRGATTETTAAHRPVFRTWAWVEVAPATARRPAYRALATELGPRCHTWVSAPAPSGARRRASARASVPAAEVWASVRTGPASSARTGSAGDSARTATTADRWGSPRTADRRSSAGRPVPVRTPASSDTPLVVDGAQPTGGCVLDARVDASPRPAHFQVQAPVRASTPATTWSYVPVIGMAMR